MLSTLGQVFLPRLGKSFSSLSLWDCFTARNRILIMDELISCQNVPSSHRWRDETILSTASLLHHGICSVTPDRRWWILPRSCSHSGMTLALATETRGKMSPSHHFSLVLEKKKTRDKKKEMSPSASWSGDQPITRGRNHSSPHQTPKRRQILAVLQWWWYCRP
jgi:hypothetical protein